MHLRYLYLQLLKTLLSCIRCLMKIFFFFCPCTVVYQQFCDSGCLLGTILPDFFFFVSCYLGTFVWHRILCKFVAKVMCSSAEFCRCIGTGFFWVYFFIDSSESCFMGSFFLIFTENFCVDCCPGIVLCYNFGESFILALLPTSGVSHGF